MKTYEVNFYERVLRVSKIEANSKEEAMEVFNKKMNDGEYWSDFVEEGVYGESNFDGIESIEEQK